MLFQNIYTLAIIHVFRAIGLGSRREFISERDHTHTHAHTNALNLHNLVSEAFVSTGRPFAVVASFKKSSPSSPGS